MTLSETSLNFLLLVISFIFKPRLIAIIFLEDAQYYIEDVRKDIIEKLTYEKVYKQGFNINTPINLELQKIATKSLRKGLIDYDKRKGWRGVLANVNYDINWFDGLEKYSLEKSIGWKVSMTLFLISSI